MQLELLNYFKKVDKQQQSNLLKIYKNCLFMMLIINQVINSLKNIVH